MLVLAYSFYTGYRRGLALQAIRLVGYIITFIFSTRMYKPLSHVIEMIVPFPAIQPDSQLALYDAAALLRIDEAFYRVLTFMLIGFIGWLVTNFLSMFFTRLSFYTLFDRVNHIGGGIINVFISFVLIFLVLFMLSLIPIEFIQQQFVNNPLAYAIVEKTPFLSEFAQTMWLSVNPF